MILPEIKTLGSELGKLCSRSLIVVADETPSCRSLVVADVKLSSRSLLVSDETPSCSSPETVLLDEKLSGFSLFDADAKLISYVKILYQLISLLLAYIMRLLSFLLF